ncbi:MAG: flavin reductase [Desulfitobacteriaceae bacterium]
MAKKWRCTVCGYVHTGETPPDICPVCGVGPERFELINEEGEKSTYAQQAVSMDKVETSKNDAIRIALFGISYGLYIITASAAGRDNGQCANTCFQVTSEPATIALGINKQNFTRELIEKSGKLGVSILNQSGQEYARRFGYSSGRDSDKFSDIAVHRGNSGVLLLDDVLSTMEATVINQLDAGTHTLYLAKVTVAELLQKGDPMTYAYFRATK